MHGAVIAGSAVLGLLVGSLLNVLIDRVPHGVPLRGERDGEASAPVSWFGLPAQPWVLRRGRHAGEPLPSRWLWVEIVTVAVFVELAVRYGDSSLLVPLLVLGASLVAVSAIDLELLRIPDRITFPTLALALPLIVVVSVQQDTTDAIPAALIGSVAYFLLLFTTHMIYPAGMGFGDVKLAGVLGLYLGWLGWAEVIAGGFLGFLFGGVVGAALMAVRRAGRKSQIPFGPFMLAGAFTAILWGGALADLYLDGVLG